MSVPLILLFHLADEAPIWILLIGLMVLMLSSPWIDRRNRDVLLSFSLEVVRFLLLGSSNLWVVIGSAVYCLQWVPFKYFGGPMDWPFAAWEGKVAHEEGANRQLGELSNLSSPKACHITSTNVDAFKSKLRE